MTNTETIGNIITKMKKRQKLRDSKKPKPNSLTPVVPEQFKKPSKPKILKHILTTWDNDIYILEGYKSADEVIEILANAGDWLRMPNGSRIKQSAISKIQSYEDYRFQINQKVHHKKGYFLGGQEQSDWIGVVEGYSGKAQVEVLTGNLEEQSQSTVKRLTNG